LFKYSILYERLERVYTYYNVRVLPILTTQPLLLEIIGSTTQFYISHELIVKKIHLIIN